MPSVSVTSVSIRTVTHEWWVCKEMERSGRGQHLLDRKPQSGWLVSQSRCELWAPPQRDPGCFSCLGVQSSWMSCDLVSKLRARYKAVTAVLQAFRYAGCRQLLTGMFCWVLCLLGHAILSFGSHQSMWVCCYYNLHGLTWSSRLTCNYSLAYMSQNVLFFLFLILWFADCDCIAFFSCSYLFWTIILQRGL